MYLHHCFLAPRGYLRSTSLSQPVFWSSRSKVYYITSRMWMFSKNHMIKEYTMLRSNITKSNWLLILECNRNVHNTFMAAKTIWTLVYHKFSLCFLLFHVMSCTHSVKKIKNKWITYHDFVGSPSLPSRPSVSCDKACQGWTWTKKHGPKSSEYRLAIAVVILTL